METITHLNAEMETKTICATCGGEGMCPDCDGSGKPSYADLVSAMGRLFEHCAMVHKYWGENCNQREADAAIANARALLTRVRGEAVTK